MSTKNSNYFLKMSLLLIAAFVVCCCYKLKRNFTVCCSYTFCAFLFYLFETIINTVFCIKKLLCVKKYLIVVLTFNFFLSTLAALTQTPNIVTNLPR